MFAVDRVIERAGENPFVRGDPADSGLHDRGQDLLRDRTFRWPHPARLAAKELFVQGHRRLQMADGVLGVTFEGLRQLAVGHPLAGGSLVPQQWEDRVIERCRGQLDLPAILQLFMQRDNAGNHFALFGQQPLLLVFV